jgi:hypothetical protein
VAKQALIRQVKSMSMSCDRVGNLLLTKFSCHGASDVAVLVPSSIVFWLLRHLPVNQDPNLQPPPGAPRITQDDWGSRDLPRAQTMHARQLPDGGLRMTYVLDRELNLTVVLDRANIELMRQILQSYAKDLIDLDAA